MDSAPSEFGRHRANKATANHGVHHADHAHASGHGATHAVPHSLASIAATHNVPKAFAARGKTAGTTQAKRPTRKIDRGKSDFKMTVSYSNEASLEQTVFDNVKVAVLKHRQYLLQVCFNQNMSLSLPFSFHAHTLALDRQYAVVVLEYNSELLLYF